METLFGFQAPPWELIVRGTCVYWFLFLLFRFILRRDAGSLALADILLIVLIADASQNGMAGEYKTLSEAFVLVGTIAFWNYLIDQLSIRYEGFARFAEPPVTPLVRHGRVLSENMRRQMVTMDELKAQLRESGLERIGDVKHAFLEADGHISIIRWTSSGDRRRKEGTPGAG